LAEFVFGIFSGSLALLSDALHMLSDVLGLIIALLAVKLATRPRSELQTYGWKRAEVIGSLINGVFLVSVVLFIILEAIPRFISPPIIDKPIYIIVVGACGLVVNVIGMIMFSSNATLRGSHSHSHGHGHGAEPGDNTDVEVGDLEHERRDEEADADDKDLRFVDDSDHVAYDEGSRRFEKPVESNANLYAVFIHMLGDAVGSVGAIVTGLVVLFVPYDWKYYADPVLSCLLALVILRSSVNVVRLATTVLMQGVPDSVDSKKLIGDILKVKGVDYVSSLHVWALSSAQLVASAHIDCLYKPNFDKISHDLKAVFESQGISNFTVQPHFVKTPFDVDMRTKLHLARVHLAEFACEC